MHERDGRPDGTVYRISFHLTSRDPRLSRREKADPTPAETAALLQQLASLDRRQAWTSRTLDLARQVGRETAAFNSGFGN